MASNVQLSRPSAGGQAGPPIRASNCVLCVDPGEAMGIDVNTVLTMFWLTVFISYSSWVQQPSRYACPGQASAHTPGCTV